MKLSLTFMSFMLLDLGALWGMSETKLISLYELQAEQQNQSKQDPIICINVVPKRICADCKIHRSINIPLHNLQSKVRFWPKNRNIVVHCAGLDCPLGKYAYDMLVQWGFNKVRLLQDGLRVLRIGNFDSIGLYQQGYLQG